MRVDLLRTLPGILLLLLPAFTTLAQESAVSKAAPPQATAAQDEAPQSDPIEWKVELEPENVRLGAELLYRVTIESPVGYEILFPSAPDLSPFVLVPPAADTDTADADEEAERKPKAVALTQREEDGRIFTKVVLHLRAYVLDVRKIPSIEVPYLRADGQTGVFILPERHARILSRLTTEDEPALAEPGEPVAVVIPNWPVIVVLIVLGSLVLAAALAWLILWWVRRQPQMAPPPPPPRPAHLVAFEKLALVESAGYLEQGEKMRFYVEVSEATREYFGNRYGFDGLSMTSLELLEALKGRDLRTVPESKVRDFLDESDLVKFAGFAPTQEEAGWLIENAYSVIRGTMLGRLPDPEAGSTVDDPVDSAGDSADTGEAGL